MSSSKALQRISLFILIAVIGCNIPQAVAPEPTPTLFLLPTAPPVEASLTFTAIAVQPGQASGEVLGESSVTEAESTQSNNVAGTPQAIPTQPGSTAVPTDTPSASGSSPGATDTPTFTPTFTETPIPTDTPTFTATATTSSSGSSSGSNNVPRGYSPNSLSGISLNYQPVVSGLIQPVGMAFAPGSNAMHVIDRPGYIRLIENGRMVEPVFLDMSYAVTTLTAEQGLLGIAFHPNYQSNGYVYTYYTGQYGNTFVTRWTARPDKRSIDPNSEQIILTFPQPNGFHNGGQITFGPDGKLYIAFGDGGESNGVHVKDHITETWLGTILRIDVDSKFPYGIPGDNPFYNQSPKRWEIWTYGLRNPWRFSFDRVTGDMYIGDVGESVAEEINFLRAGYKGLDYGWPFTEGNNCHVASPDCTPSRYERPAYVYGHTGHCAVTGGYVYRGSAISNLYGTYVFGDYCSGTIWGLIYTASGWQAQVISNPTMYISSFGEDNNGELYIIDYAGNSVYKIVP